MNSYCLSNRYDLLVITTGEILGIANLECVELFPRYATSKTGAEPKSRISRLRTIAPRCILASDLGQYACVP